MDTFDYYSPQPAIRCPDCGALLHGWKGKDASCERFLWLQGQNAPVDQLVDDAEQLSLEERAQRRLPERFGMHTSCEICKLEAEASGFVVDGVWSATVLGNHAALIATQAVLIERARRKCLACAHAWEDIAGNVFSQCPACKALTKLDEASPAPSP